MPVFVSERNHQASRPLPVRLAMVLLNLAKAHGTSTSAGTHIGLKLSQRDLSNLVDATRESVNKQLRGWREEELLIAEGGYLLIPDMKRFRAVIEADLETGHDLLVDNSWRPENAASHNLRSDDGVDDVADPAQQSVIRDIDALLARLEHGIAAERVAMDRLLDRMTRTSG